MPPSRRNLRRVPSEPGSPVEVCPSCGVCLLTAAQLTELLPIAHSTVALRLKNAGIAPVAYEGERALYISAQALPVLVRGSD